MTDTREDTARKILARLHETFPGTTFTTTLEEDNGHDTLFIHYDQANGPRWDAVIAAACLAICPMEIARPRLCLDVAPLLHERRD